MYGKPGNFGENSNGMVHPRGNFPEKSNTLSAYHFARKFRWKILSNGTGIFLGTENRNGIQLYHLQNTGKVSAFSGHEA